MISIEQLQVVKAIAVELKTFPPYILLSGAAFLYFYKKKKNGKNGNGKITKTNIDLAIKTQEGLCRDRFYSALKSTEKNIIAEIKNNNNHKEGN